MKQRVLVLFGGESSEHDVSIASARNVVAALDASAYDISLCYISRDGVWKLVESPDSLEGNVSLRPVLGEKRFVASDGEDLAVDVLLPVLHGIHGEDGDVQGLARLLHIACVGPSLIGAAVTMDKDLTKRLLRDANIPVVDWVCWRTSDERPIYDDIAEQLGSTLFVKPSNAGSSVGVTRVSDLTTFESALDGAAEHDSLVLIERAVKGREIEVAVLGNQEPQVTAGGEIVPGEEFYSYDDKYSPDSKSEVIIPADLDEIVSSTIKRYALDAYKATRGQGMARIDFFVSEDNGIYLNEINSIPGFTDISMYPKLWGNEGLSYTKLLDKLISLSLES